MIILPTKGRPHSLARFVHQYYLTKATLPIHVIFDERDAYRYNGIKTPEHWRRVSVKEGTPLGGIFTLMFNKYPNEPFYGMVADDVLPETMEWDVKLRDACLPDKISWGADGIQDEQLPVHPFIGGDLLRHVGWWAAPGLKHWFVDNVWKDLATLTNRAAYCPDIKMTHLHPIAGRAGNDRTYAEQPSHYSDHFMYSEFVKNEFPKVLDKLKLVGLVPK